MHSEEYNVIGLMSGTSLDGLDIVYTKLSFFNGSWNFELVEATTIQYSNKWHQRLKKAHKNKPKELDTLDKEYGLFLGGQINSFIKKYKIQKVDLVASHGHTVLHQPEKKITVQIGNGLKIAKKTGITCIYDFRTSDVKMGGQGAPLVPIGDHFLFNDYDYCLNLGGIANISFKQKKKRIAYDICPANMVLNKLARKANLDYDNGGKLASKGSIIETLLDLLNSLHYYQIPFPKSMGREWVKAEIKPILKASQQFTLEDQLATFCEHIAIQIHKSLPSSGKLLITGGGAHHTFLVNRIRHHCSSNKVIIPTTIIVEFKEALIFALLGVLRYRNEINVLASVTGAPHDHSGGVIAYAS